MIRQDLYDKFKRLYEDVVFIIATNQLPATEAQARDKWNKNIWRPITARVDISSISDSHGDSEKFPYTSGQLAQALHLLSRYPELCTEMEEIDEEEAPDEEADDWYLDQELIQKDAFRMNLEYFALMHPEEDIDPLGG